MHLILKQKHIVFFYVKFIFHDSLLHFVHSSTPENLIFLMKAFIHQSYVKFLDVK